MPSAPRLPHAATSGEQQACQHELKLKRLEPDLDTMRQLITCKICQRFLSEPYGLACGHTYCYVCLDAWLVAQKKRTCPDCRATIKEQPVPSYLIREMTRVFAYRQELLPEGETVEEHDEYIKEAVAQVSGDKETGGLFSGLFKGGRMHWMPLHDPGDDVDRCPNCHWELEEGSCGSCGLNIGDEDGFGLDTGESENSDDDDDELDIDVVPHDYDGMDDPGSFDEDDYMDFPLPPKAAHHTHSPANNHTRSQFCTRTETATAKAPLKIRASTPRPVTPQQFYFTANVAAFARLLDVFSTADPDGRASIRARLLELFEVVGLEDERVLAARRRLTNLLF